MASIYDDISYVESMNDIMINDEGINIQMTIEDIKDKENDFNKNVCSNEDDENDEFDYIIDQNSRKTMFEKLLKETLDELNKTNPVLEVGKYHLLCIYSKRYYRFIENIDNSIIRYELKQLKKLKRQNPNNEWYWDWKTMTFYIFKHIQNYYNSEKHFMVIEKNINDKKRD
jgi:hypothetical protein